MAASSKFLPLNHMEAAIITSATSEATGFPKENLLDMNPDTYWKPTSTAMQEIVIDLGTGRLVDSFALWIHNYTTDFSAATIKIEYSDNGSTWTMCYNTVSIANSTSNPIYPVLSPGNSWGTHRYWRFTIASLPSVIEISMIALSYVPFYLITWANELPVNDSEQYYNRHEVGPGGRRFNFGINKKAAKTISRTYRINGTTDLAILKALFDACRGGGLPTVIVDNADTSTALLVYIDNDKWQPVEDAYQLYKVTLTFVQAPYIQPGETY